MSSFLRPVVARSSFRFVILWIDCATGGRKGGKGKNWEWKRRCVHIPLYHPHKDRDGMDYDSGTTRQDFFFVNMEKVVDRLFVM